MVTKKQKKIIQDIKKTSKELKKKGISSREVILIMTSILILAVAVMGFTVLGNEINELSIESDRRIRLIERLNNLIEEKDAKLNKLKNKRGKLIMREINYQEMIENFKNENLKLKGEIENFKNELEKLNKKANDLEVINEHLEGSNKHWDESYDVVSADLRAIHSELTLMTNKKKFLERKNKQLERTIKNFPFLWSTYLDDLTKDLHGYTNLKKRHLKLKKRTKESMKYHQDIAKERQKENIKLQNALKKKPAWKPTGKPYYTSIKRLNKKSNTL